LFELKFFKQSHRKRFANFVDVDSKSPPTERHDAHHFMLKVALLSPAKHQDSRHKHLNVEIPAK